MSIVKVQSVASVHFRITGCHQMKKRHHIWLLSKVFTDLEKVFFLKWRCPPWEAFRWWRGECSSDPAVRPVVEDRGMHRRSESRTGRHCLEDQTADSGFLESAEVGSHRLSGPQRTSGADWVRNLSFKITFPSSLSGSISVNLRRASLRLSRNLPGASFSSCSMSASLP